MRRLFHCRPSAKSLWTDGLIQSRASDLAREPPRDAPRAGRLIGQPPPSSSSTGQLHDLPLRSLVLTWGEGWVPPHFPSWLVPLFFSALPIALPPFHPYPLASGCSAQPINSDGRQGCQRFVQQLRHWIALLSAPWYPLGLRPELGRGRRLCSPPGRCPLTTHTAPSPAQIFTVERTRPPSSRLFVLRLFFCFSRV
jgi:hypothetical protein